MRAMNEKESAAAAQSDVDDMSHGHPSDLGNGEEGEPGESEES